MKVTIYTNKPSMQSPILMVKSMWKDLISSKDLSLQLAVRDIKAQYRQSILGILWAFLLPLANTLIWMYLQGTGIINVGKTEIPYPVFVFTGTMIWSIFVDSVQMPLNQIIASRSILAKINFPTEALFLSGIYQVIFNAAIKILLMVAALLLLGIYPNWNLFLVPFAIISLIITGTAIGLFLTPIGLLYNDIGKIIPFGLQILMFTTPVLFPMPVNGWAHIIYYYNPLTSIVITTRQWLIGQGADYLPSFITVNIAMTFVLITVWVVFRIAKPLLTERMGS